MPDSFDDAIALGKAALQFNDVDTAQRVLVELEPRAKLSALYQELRGQLAMTRSEKAAAQEWFAKAAELEPSNKHYRFNLATAQLQSNLPQARSSAHAFLKQVLQDKELRASAARALRDDYAQQKDANGLLEMSQLLYRCEEATFNDRILYAKVLHALGRPEFTTVLTELQNAAASDPSKIVELLSWMNSDGLAIVALDWIKRLPAEVVNRRPVPVAVADCYIAMGDRDGLEQWCTQSNWGDLEFAREAYLSWVLRGRGETEAFQTHWKRALDEAATDGDRLHTLEKAAVKWGWQQESENLLWMLTKDLQKQTASLGALYQYYADKGDTGNLYRVVARFSEIKNDDDKTQNNLAQLALLLNVNLERAHAAAERLYRKNPKDPIYASTYGFSLYRKGRYAEAVKVMNNLDPIALKEPGTAAYYGLFLAAAGDNAKASEYMEKGFQAPLLPEEKALLQEARARVSARSN